MPTERLIQAKDHERIKILFMTDPHFTDTDPPAYKTNYLENLLVAIESAYSYARKNHADLVVWGGDIFHRKSARQNSHALVAKVIKTLRKSQIPNVGILGNHDLLFGSLDRGLAGQPAEVLLESDQYHLLDTEPVIVYGSDDLRVKVAGGSYHHAQAAHVRAIKKEDNTYLVAVGHFWFGAQTGQFFGEPIYGPDYLEESEVDMYLMGHHHEDQGVRVINRKTYVSAGSISRTGAHKQDLIRKPAAVWVVATKDALTATVLRPKALLADEIMDLTTIAKIKEENQELDRLTAALEAAETTVADPHEMLAQLTVPEEVRLRTKEYLEKAEQGE